MITFSDIQGVDNYYTRTGEAVPVWMKKEQVYNCEPYFEEKKEKPFFFFHKSKKTLAN